MNNQNNQNININNANPAQPNNLQQAQNLSQLNLQNQLLQNGHHPQLQNTQDFKASITAQDRNEIVLKLAQLFKLLNSASSDSEALNIARNLEINIYSRSVTKQQYLVTCSRKIKEIDDKVKQLQAQNITQNMNQQQNLAQRIQMLQHHQQQQQQLQNTEMLRQSLQNQYNLNLQQQAGNNVNNVNPMAAAGINQNILQNRGLNPNLMGAMANLNYRNNFSQLNPQVQGQPGQFQLPNGITPSQLAMLKANPTLLSMYQRQALLNNQGINQLNNLPINSQMNLPQNLINQAVTQPNSAIAAAISQVANRPTQLQPNTLNSASPMPTNPTTGQSTATTVNKVAQPNTATVNPSPVAPTSQPRTQAAVPPTQNITVTSSQTQNTSNAAVASQPRTSETNDAPNIPNSEELEVIKPFTSEEIEKTLGEIQKLKNIVQPSNNPILENVTDSQRQRATELISMAPRFLSTVEQYLPIIYLRCGFKICGFVLTVREILNQQIKMAPNIIMEEFQIQKITNVANFIIKEVAKYLKGVANWKAQEASKNQNVTTTNAGNQVSVEQGANTITKKEPQSVQDNAQTSAKSKEVNKLEEKSKESSSKGLGEFVTHISESKLTLKPPPPPKKPTIPLENEKPTVNIANVTVQQPSQSQSQSQSQPQPQPPSQKVTLEPKTLVKTVSSEVSKTIPQVPVSKSIETLEQQVEHIKEDLGTVLKENIVSENQGNIVMVVNPEQAKLLKAQAARKREEEEEQKYGDGILIRLERKEKKLKKKNSLAKFEKVMNELMEHYPDYKTVQQSIKRNAISKMFSNEFPNLFNELELELTSEMKSNAISKQEVNALVCFPFDCPDQV